MNTIKKEMMEINRLCNESDEIYHNIARNYGLTDSIYWILYILHNYDEPVSQVDLCNNWSYSKQTVNTSIAALLKKEWITLEVIPNTRNRKRIVLTETGKQFCEKAIGETQEIEQTAFSRISKEEREIFITVFRKLNLFMQEECEKKHFFPTD